MYAVETLRVCCEANRCVCINVDGSRCKRCRAPGQLKCTQHLKQRCEFQVAEYVNNVLDPEVVERFRLAREDREAAQVLLDRADKLTSSLNVPLSYQTPCKNVRIPNVPFVPSVPSSYVPNAGEARERAARAAKAAMMAGPMAGPTEKDYPGVFAPFRPTAAPTEKDYPGVF